MNDYVATAAAEKRLREVINAKFAYPTDADGMVDVLLSSAKIEYKARVKQVTITLDLPDTATPKPAPAEPVNVEPDPPAGPPTPHVMPFEPRDVEPDYEDLHFD